MTARAGIVAFALALATGSALVAQDRPAAGAGRIEGRVELMSGGAVRRATVTLAGDLPRSRTVITDDDGGFVFEGLPAGRFTVTAERPGFITSSYGAFRPGRPGTAVSLSAGQQLANVVIRIARGAALAGTIRDEHGDPVPGARVAALSLEPMDARTATLLSVGLVADPTTFALTDERGVYRIWGLPAGSYLLSVSPQQFISEAIETVTPTEMDARFARASALLLSLPSAVPPVSALGRPATAPASADPLQSYTPVFYPGTPSVANAQPIDLDFGDERSGLDMTFAPTPSRVVAGTVRTAGGAWPRVQLTLAMDVPVHMPRQVERRPALSFDQSSTTATSVDFRFTGVAPDRYTVIARTVGGSPPLWASAEVDVSAGDISGVDVALRPPIRLSGRVRFEGAAAAPPDLTKLPVGLERVTSGIGETVGFRPAMYQGLPAGNTSVQADGSFTLPAVHPGVFTVSAGVPPGGGPWRLQSAMLGERDLLDDPLVVAPDRRDDITGVVLTFGDRRTEISGRLQTSAGIPAPEYYIVVFTTERRWWRRDGRRLAVTRPASDGQFVLRDLPPGRYHLAALTDLDTATWQRPEFLDQVVAGALSFDLGEGETRTQDLQIAGK
jgi:hypothetical protein